MLIGLELENLRCRIGHRCKSRCNNLFAGGGNLSSRSSNHRGDTIVLCVCTRAHARTASLYNRTLPQIVMLRRYIDGETPSLHRHHIKLSPFNKHNKMQQKHDYKIDTPTGCHGSQQHTKLAVLYMLIL